ncbi:MAG: NADH-quinone oxidoreductase subunit J [Gemmataceae bacterium]|nr:NADH-quinone oxidoreductase subunit J [Gemmataceae bacterium]
MENVSTFLFWTIASLTGLCAVAVVVSQNIVRAATWLLFTLGGVAGLFFLLGADFVGATQLLVYVGGTLVLVVFAVMLTAQGPFITMKTSAAEWALSGLVGLLLLATLTISSLSAGRPTTKPDVIVKYGQRTTLTEEARKAAKDEPEAVAKHTDTLGQGFLGIGVGPPRYEIDKDGRYKKDKDGRRVATRTHYFLPFILVSVHLLVVLIGAAYLARAKRRRRVAPALAQEGATT